MVAYDRISPVSIARIELFGISIPDDMLKHTRYIRRFPGNRE